MPGCDGAGFRRGRVRAPGTVEVRRMWFRVTVLRNVVDRDLAVQPRAAMTETSASKGTKASRMDGAWPMAAKAAAASSGVAKRAWPLPS